MVVVSQLTARDRLIETRPKRKDVKLFLGLVTIASCTVSRWATSSSASMTV